MKKMILSFAVLLLILLFFIDCRESRDKSKSDIAANMALEERVTQQIESYIKGEFHTPSSLIEDGWVMDVNGKPKTRSFLNCQASYIISEGIDAVPVLLKYIGHVKQYIRYIAAYSLKEITGENPTFYYFGTPGKDFSGDTDWCKNAVDTWEKWYQDHRK
ncbi:MAG: hypothetical protein E3J87_01380 [Candidatus Cloacimonadota bacterium]|nr:MAG: hypothetical protein E3J87_01380 [Candidatus Cloacimonadota bacterium]